MKVPKKSESSVSKKTRKRILQAAEKIFARGGYRAMTLREVTNEANVNLAAVNYHFGSKTNLMRALIRERFEPINQQRLALLAERVEAHTEGGAAHRNLRCTVPPALHGHRIRTRQRHHADADHRPCTHRAR